MIDFAPLEKQGRWISSRTTTGGGAALTKRGSPSAVVL